MMKELFDQADIIYSCDAKTHREPYVVHKVNELSKLQVGIYPRDLDGAKLHPKYPCGIGKHTYKGRLYHFLKHFDTNEEYIKYKGWTKFTEEKGWH